MVDKNSPVDHCPTCQDPIGGFHGLRYVKKTGGLVHLTSLHTYQPREDRQLQAIVNQVVPGLEVEEEQRRKKFYEEHGKEEEADQNEEDGVFDP